MTITSLRTLNLLVTGQAISMVHEALASARVMRPCFAEGQAAGTAAALAVKNGCRSPDIVIKNLQSELKKEGARLERGLIGGP
ncbi:MAG: FAD-dependent oxidoreductase [Syntrophales bacterium LBB04]|nr:FAD-dependent oxidoreductase [Syntrophales bacterium LBB04]